MLSLMIPYIQGDSLTNHWFKGASFEQTIRPNDFENHEVGPFEKCPRAKSKTSKLTTFIKVTFPTSSE